MRWFILTMIVLAGSGEALAVTPDELAALAKAGLGDEVLLELIESTGVDPSVTAARALTLKTAGVSDRVITAAIRRSHQPPAEVIADPIVSPCVGCDDNVAVIGGQPPAVVVEREVYYLPWIWGAPVRPGHPHASRPYFEGNKRFGRFINDGTVIRPATRR